VTYAVKVTDREDAAVARDRVAVSINHLPEDVDLSGLAHETNAVDATTRYGVAKTLLARTDCSGCHARDTASIGPTYVMLAAKYQPDPTTLGVLANKVKAGSSKVWGEAEMPPHPNLTTGEIRTILEYFLNVGNSAISTLPLEGSHTPELPDGRGRVVVRAVYTDMPVGSLPAQTSVAMKVLRGPMLNPASADVFENVTFGARSSGAGAETRGLAITAQQNGYIGFRQIDLTGIRELTLTVSTAGDMWAKGGIIEVRTGGPNGQLIGTATVAVAPRPARGRGAGAAPAPPPPAPTITLRPSTGFHDMYFVFRNDQATPAEPLMTVSAIVVN
jgi:cytochrome c